MYSKGAGNISVVLSLFLSCELLTMVLVDQAVCPSCLLHADLVLTETGIYSIYDNTNISNPRLLDPVSSHGL